jgi:hypothetical protein
MRTRIFALVAVGLFACAKDPEREMRKAREEARDTAREQRVEQEKLAAEQGREQARLDKKQENERTAMQAEQAEERIEGRKELYEAGAKAAADRGLIKSDQQERLKKIDTRARELKAKTALAAPKSQSVVKDDWVLYDQSRTKTEREISDLTKVPTDEVTTRQAKVQDCLDDLDGRLGTIQSKLK